MAQSFSRNMEARAPLRNTTLIWVGCRVSSPRELQDVSENRKPVRLTTAAHLIDMVQKIGRILVDAVGARTLQLLLSVAAG